MSILFLVEKIILRHFILATFSLFLVIQKLHSDANLVKWFTLQLCPKDVKIQIFFENDLVEREIRQVTKVTFFDDFEGFRIWCKTLESETAEDHLLELTCVSDALMIDEGVRRISILG